VYWIGIQNIGLATTLEMWKLYKIRDNDPERDIQQERGKERQEEQL
jgi:hypothetical protein